MRYLESLKFDVPVPSKRWSMCRDSPSLGTGVAYNPVLNKHDVYGTWYLLRERDILGVGMDEVAQVGHAVCHTAKTAMLHRFVVDAETKKGPVDMSFTGVDSCTMYNTALFGMNRCGENCKTLNILSPEASIHLFGPAGSVVMWTSGVTYKLMTLFDYLVELSRENGIDLLRYKRIRFVSESLKVLSTICLSDTVEAERFFNKMRFEITRRR